MTSPRPWCDWTSARMPFRPTVGHGVEPLGWSSDGTELLVTRWKGLVGTYYVAPRGWNRNPRIEPVPGVGAATAAISPDGSRVAFESQGLAIVDIEGGGAVKLPYPTGGEPDRVNDLLPRRDADRVPRERRGVGGERGRHRRARDPGRRAGLGKGRGQHHVVAGGRPPRDRCGAMRSTPSRPTARTSRR